MTFRVTAQGFFMAPGEIIEVVDEAKTAEVFAGVIQDGSTSTNVRVDNLPAFVGGNTYEMTVRLETKTVNVVASLATAGAAPRVIVTSGFGVVPKTGELFLVKKVGGAKPRKYRVMGILESEEGTVTVTATAYNEDKYNTVDVNTFFDSGVKSMAGVRVTPKVVKGSIVLRTT